jgi:hypothetical protein
VLREEIAGSYQLPQLFRPLQLASDLVTHINTLRTFTILPAPYWSSSSQPRKDAYPPPLRLSRI